MKKLNSAGVLPFVRQQAPPDVRKVMDEVNFLNLDKSPLNINDSG